MTQRSQRMNSGTWNWWPLPHWTQGSNFQSAEIPRNITAVSLRVTMLITDVLLQAGAHHEDQAPVNSSVAVPVSESGGIPTPGPT